MLVWAAEFPLRSGSNTDDVIKLAKKWIVGSPHSTWEDSIFKDEPQNEITVYKHGGQTFSIARASKDADAWCSIRHQWVEDGTREWATEIASHQTPLKHTISIQVHCDLIKVGPEISRSKKPYIVRLVLENIGGGDDAGLPISDDPIELAETDVEKAASIISGTLGNSLPVIYASRAWNGQLTIDAIRLAQWASGMAHVVTEPSRKFSLTLAQKVSHQNAYGGAVSIYWPGGAGRQSKLLPDNFTSPARLAGAVSGILRSAHSSSRPTIDCTWAYIRDLIATTEMAALKASGSKDVDDYIAKFDAEISAKDELVKKAEEEIGRLRAEIQRADATNEIAADGILKAGKEKPFYAGEIRDTVIKALETARNQFLDDGRRRHIVDDLLKSNAVGSEADKISNEIKRVLSDKDMRSSDRRTLEQIGFALSDDGKHIKAVFHGDGRYTFSIQKTGSDWRGLKNLASDICKKLFK